MISHEYVLGHQRGVDDEPRFLLAVRPDGKIRPLRYSVNGHSKALKAERLLGRDGKRVVGLNEIELAKSYRTAGWVTVDDLIEEEARALEANGDDEGAAARRQDLETIYRWYAVALNRKSGSISPLPEGYMPERIAEMRRDEGPDFVVDIPAPSTSRRKRRRKASTSDAPAEE